MRVGRRAPQGEQLSDPQCCGPPAPQPAAPGPRAAPLTLPPGGGAPGSAGARGERGRAGQGRGQAARTAPGKRVEEERGGRGVRGGPVAGVGDGGGGEVAVGVELGPEASGVPAAPTPATDRVIRSPASAGAPTPTRTWWGHTARGLRPPGLWDPQKTLTSPVGGRDPSPGQGRTEKGLWPECVTLSLAGSCLQNDCRMQALGKRRGPGPCFLRQTFHPHITRHVGLVKRLDPGSVPGKKEGRDICPL